MQTLGIYIQVPFCASKCSFCNFSSQVAPHAVFHAYVQAIEREIERLADIYATAGIVPSDDHRDKAAGLLDLPVDTVYLGGGTPSLLGSERLARIVVALERRFQFAPPVEFTIEGTPGSADDRELERLRALGINRLSIGAQSFADRELTSVGRLHSAADTAELVESARRAGFTNISLDLIAGLPHQTAASWLHSLEATADLAPQHVSVYLFEVDEKSRLGSEVLSHGTHYHAGAVPDDEFMADAYERARSFLSDHGYAQYEISNFAQPGFESRHNRKYWRLEPYVGLGAGAHSFDGLKRWSNETSPEVYQARLERDGSPIAEVRWLSLDQQIEEFFFLGLRESTGVDVGAAAERWGRSTLDRWQPAIAALREQGWIEESGGRIRLPERSHLISNEIFQEFLV
ncbi:MAG TPA: radical SAM family heme chaperone HemW [Terriglobia bacterium]|nr:radical SAM family heme chaperone HemW [Terriglobia bacterium]